MRLQTLGPLGIMVLGFACANSKDSKPPLHVGCPIGVTCQEEKLWSEDAQAILLEKVGGDLAGNVAGRSLYFERSELSDEQRKNLESWSLAPLSADLSCVQAVDGVTYKATIFKSNGKKATYFATDNACIQDLASQSYVHTQNFKSFPWAVPYNPDERQDYAIIAVETTNSSLKVVVRHSEGCASYRTFNLVLDGNVQDSQPPVIQGYLRHRTDNTCKALGNSELTINLSEHNLLGAKVLNLKGWPKSIPLE